jgi:hypothetical protein
MTTSPRRAVGERVLQPPAAARESADESLIQLALAASTSVQRIDERQGANSMRDPPLCRAGHH